MSIRGPFAIPARLVPALALGLAAFVTAAATAAAQPAVLVRDIRTGPEFIHPEPAQLFAAGNHLFFTAATPGTGREMWATDGTPNGTMLLGDLCPDSCSSDPVPAVALGQALLFVTRDDQDERLWRSDGTPAGTLPLTEPLQIGTPDEGHRFLALAGRAFFAACTDESGCELWASDGTAAGTRLLAESEPGPASGGAEQLTRSGDRIYYVTRAAGRFELWATRPDGRSASRVLELPSLPELLTAAGGKLFFTAPFADRGRELWVSDGTAAGTRPLTDLDGNGILQVPARPLVALGGRVYFVADDGVHGEEIWASDGTLAGTRRVTDFAHADPFASRPDLPQMALVGNRLLFSVSAGGGRASLWKTDGTPGTTAPVGEARLLAGLPFLPLGGRVLFVTHDDEPGLELWASDGTPGGTLSLTAGCRGACDLTTSGRLVGNAVFFGGQGADGKSTLWRTDGTRAGTRRFSDPEAPEPFVPQSFQVAALGRDVFFVAASDEGTELWKSDGRRGGTRLVTDLAPDNPGSEPARMAASGDSVLFSACNPSFRYLWHSRGSAATTVQISDHGFAHCGRSAEEEVPPIAAFGSFFFLREDFLFGPRQLWKSDGTPAGTVQLTHLTTAGDPNGRLATLGSAVYFSDGFRSAWKSDGTPAGTGPAFTLPAGTFGPGALTATGPELYFLSNTDVWASDGTQAGTRRLLDLESSFFNIPAPEFTRLGSHVFFVVDAGITTDRLWRTDGSPAGTRPVRGEVRSSPSHLTVLGGALYFFDGVPEAGRGLWRTDGTAEGTVLVRSFRAAPSGRDGRPALLAGRLFFAADDGVHGRELWVSDGTPEGTALVLDVAPGAASSAPRALTAAGDRLFWSAHDGAHGRELWQSDSAGAGARLIHDIAPGALSSSPEELTAAAGRLYFSADDGLHGHELWMVPLAGPGGCQPAATRLCLGGGRFAVEAEWQDFQGQRGSGQAVALTADTGTFWFFDPANVEVIVKILDGRGVNDHFWVFYGALSSVEYSLVVTDTQTGLTRRYWNPSGQLASFADTEGFGPRGAHATTVRAAAAPALPRLVSARTEPAAATGICEPGATRLCLNGGRFAVEAAWEDFEGNAGTGQAVSLTGDTGYFWFFDADNVEVVLKVLDGRAVNDHFWVFYGALSNVEYTLTVTDTETGAVRTYENPSGRLASAADTGAF